MKKLNIILPFLCLITAGAYAETKHKTALQALDCDENAEVYSENSCPYPFDIEKTDPNFTRIIHTVKNNPELGSLEQVSDVFTGPQTPLKPIVIAGVSWLSSGSCEAHNCGNHFINYLYQPVLKGFVGIYHHDDKVVLIGNPSPEQLKLLKSF